MAVPADHEFYRELAKHCLAQAETLAPSIAAIGMRKLGEQYLDLARRALLAGPGGARPPEP